MKNINACLETARAELSAALEHMTAGKMTAADKSFQNCRSSILRAERMCDEISGEMKCWIGGVKP